MLQRFKVSAYFVDDLEFPVDKFFKEKTLFLFTELSTVFITAQYPGLLGSDYFLKKNY